MAKTADLDVTVHLDKTDAAVRVAAGNFAAAIVEHCELTDVLVDAVEMVRDTVMLVLAADAARAEELEQARLAGERKGHKEGCRLVAGEANELALRMERAKTDGQPDWYAVKDAVWQIASHGDG